MKCTIIKIKYNFSYKLLHSIWSKPIKKARGIALAQRPEFDVI
jgi:hypothetical protein